MKIVTNFNGMYRKKNNLSLKKEVWSSWEGEATRPVCHPGGTVAPRDSGWPGQCSPSCPAPLAAGYQLPAPALLYLFHSVQHLNEGFGCSLIGRAAL